MAKVTVHSQHDTPSQAVIKAVNQLVYVTDTAGRKIGLKQPPFLAEFDIIEIVGPDKAKNITYMGMLNPLLYIAEIDGEPVDFPKTQIQVRALIQKADRSGFIAALEGITSHFAADQTGADEQIKNADGTPG